MTAIVIAWAKFGICAALIGLTGPALIRYGDIIARRTGVSRTWIGLVLLQQEITHLPSWKQVLIFVSFATLAGVLWEFAEFVVGTGEHVVPWLYRWFHGGDLPDTIMDLTADIIGALVLSLWALAKERR